MIPVRFVKGATVGVLGLGRSGMAAAEALEAGGATVILWDDNAPARDKAEGYGYDTRDLSRDDVMAELDLLVVSPGIPHRLPKAHPAARAAEAAGAPILTLEDPALAAETRLLESRLASRTCTLRPTRPSPRPTRPACRWTTISGCSSGHWRPRRGTVSTCRRA